jgi:Family of unknown function (DUF5681)
LDASWTLNGKGHGMKTTAKQREDYAERPGGITGKGFLPGQSGNPLGRPRTARFSEAARRLAEEIGQNGSTGAEQLAEYCFHRALKGSVRHAELFLHYTEGRPRQAVELSGPNASAVRFQNMTDEELEARLKELLGKYQDSNS